MSMNLAELTNQELKWCINHLQEATDRIERVAELTGDVPMAESDSWLTEGYYRTSDALLQLYQEVERRENDRQ